jgi:tryptophanyl-tRNA synthetase
MRRSRGLGDVYKRQHLINVLHAGADKARTVASATVAETYKNLGLVL